MDEEQAIGLLKKHIKDKEAFDIIFRHAKKVQEISLRYAKQIPNVNIEFIKIASLLHDIGRGECPPGKQSIFHGIKGAEILRKEGLEKYADVAERHLGVGISKEEIIKQKLPLPEKDFSPATVEEKIITMADNLVKGDQEITLQETMQRFRDEIGEEVAQKIKKLHDELESMKK